LQDMTLQDESAGDDNAGHDNVRQTTLRIFGGVTVVSVSFLRNTRHFTFCHVFLLHGTNQITIRIQISTTFLYSCKVSTCHFLRDAMLAWYMLWPCVCLSLSVCLSQVGVLLKWLNIGSRKQHHARAHGFYFSETKDLHEIRLVF